MNSTIMVINNTRVRKINLKALFFLMLLAVFANFSTLVSESYSDSVSSKTITGSGTLIGTSNNDNIIVDPPNIPTAINGRGGGDSIKGSAGGDHILAGNGDDSVTGDPREGDSGDDLIFGEDGYDDLYGLKGSDYIDGGEDDDILYGGTDNDVLSGGKGKDRLYGNEGNDILRGGPDRDFFDCGSEIDVVQDFQKGIDDSPVGCEVVKVVN